MFAIRGSGFGLYGYLPALVHGCAQRIILPERYRARLESRSELSPFASAVEWESDDRTLLDRANGVAIAIRPANQRDLIPEYLARTNIEFLLLEKPLAPSPQIAAALLENLIDSRKTFRVGYILRNTSWGKQLLATLARKEAGGRLTIRWSFLAHHFLEDLRNWKRYSDTGGGAVRFYGIHLIALLAEAGYRDVPLSETFGDSPNECEKWIAAFAGPGLPECEVLVDTRSAGRAFQVEWVAGSTQTTTMTFAALGDPFDSDVDPRTGDRRVPALSEACRSLWQSTGNEYAVYEAANALWRSVEDRTRFVADARA